MKAGDIRKLMRNRWLNFIESLSGSGIKVHGDTGELFENLNWLYSEGSRYYHNWTHISACLYELEESKFLALHPVAVEMALWFHDAVYVPGAGDNEELSARMARSASESMNFPSETAREVEKLILATRYLTDDDTPDELCLQDSALVRDIDLSVLGATRKEFDKYEEAIGLEYGSIPDRERRQRRIHVLEGFLALPRIYETEHFHQRYEEQARQNLNRSIRRIRRLLVG